MTIKEFPSGSAILAEEYFSTQDARFVDEIRKLYSIKKLAGFADRWKRDHRPWAREQIFAYLEKPLDASEHQPLVKRLFKHAEEIKDDELMAAFMTAFDRLVRHDRKKRWRWDPFSRRGYNEEYLSAPHNVLPTMAELKKWGFKPQTGEQMVFFLRRRGGYLFSYHTRYYLRRRAWRYFRKMGYQRPYDYPKAVAFALKRYKDADVLKGEDLLDNWGLINACFRHHDALFFGTGKIKLKTGHSLDELTAAPRFPELWEKPESMAILMDLAIDAHARVVRIWAVELLKKMHDKRWAEISTEDLMRLLEHEDEEIQMFGAEIMQAGEHLRNASLDVWTRLLEIKNMTALSLVCEAMIRFVSPDRLDTNRLLDLACAAPAPVARMGLDFLKMQSFAFSHEREKLARLSGAQCAAAAGDITDFALSLLGCTEHYDREAVIEFFDGLLPEMRTRAWAWLTPDSPGYDDPALWSRLIETPFDDIRLELVKILEKRAKLPGVTADDLTPVWCAVLLAVNKGGRRKPGAIRQIADTIQKDPDKADALLPVLAAVVRSIRHPEQRAGLTAVVQLADRHPELSAKITTSIPELNLSPGEKTS